MNKNTATAAPKVQMGSYLTAAQFALANNATGWFVFLFSLIVYTLTVEETASFWDCGEFISVSYKLMVPHPPGAPFFLLLGRMFSFLALGDVMQVAFWINMMSVLASAFTILFLFWTITLLARKIQRPDSAGNFTLSESLSILGAGLVGSIAYTFSDSFWFSAVEAEVYAMSSFLTAWMFWAILKWELLDEGAAKNRFLILIAYVIGLSIGVHLLNLVTLPAMGLVMYFHYYQKPSVLGILSALAASGAVLLGVMYVIIPGLPSFAGNVEVFLINNLGLPFGTGVALFVFALLFGVVFGIYYTQKHALVLYNNIMLCLAFILIGYSSYTLAIIRSNFDTPINENDPSDIIGYVSYLKREQYGDRPLVYGNTFLSEQVEHEDAAPLYRKGKDRYEIYGYKSKARYNGPHNLLLPRLYSQQEGHKELYMQWLGLSKIDPNKPISADNIKDAEGRRVTKLTQKHNLSFLFSYQFGHMYFRYLGWNFIGRESDEKEAGVLMPWESKKDAVYEVAINKARNNFYALPFVLGILGLIYYFSKDKKSAWVSVLLFFLTGLALVLYLNSPPTEPRERDYIYVGSFYVFAIWIGFAVMAIGEYLSVLFKRSTVAAGLSVAICLPPPIWMGVEGWDNHDRSNRFHSVDQARNALASCAPNAILFTGGDNDTFPLWYVQEVEGFRTDVRVVVLSYFSTDWYIRQMRRKVYESEALPIKMKMENYLQNKNDYVPLYTQDQENKNQPINLKTYIKLLDENDSRLMVPLSNGQMTARLLSNTFVLKNDSAQIANSGIVPKGFENRIATNMTFSLKPGRTYIMKSDLAILDILAHNNWERPVYFNNTSSNSTHFNFSNYLFIEGTTMRLLPVQGFPAKGDMGTVNTEVMLENLKKFQFRGFDDENTYNDDEYRKFAENTRHQFYRLAERLSETGQNERARQILDTALVLMPDKTVPYGYFMPYYIDLYYRLGEVNKGSELTEIMTQRCKQSLDFIARNKNAKADMVAYDMARRAAIVTYQMADIHRRYVDLKQNQVEVLQKDSASNSVELQAAKKQLETFQNHFTTLSENLEKSGAMEFLR
jgi:hypothetical protein